MQPDVKLHEESPERGRAIRAGHIKAEALAARDDASIGRHLVPKPFLADLAAFHFLMPVEKECEIAGAGTADREVLAILRRCLRRETSDDAFERPCEGIDRLEDTSGPDLDLLREHGGRAGDDDCIKQEAEHDSEPAVDGHHQLGFPLGQADHRLASCEAEVTGGFEK